MLTVTPDHILGSLFEQKGAAEQRLASLAKEPKGENLEAVKTSALIEDLNQKIKNRVEGILVGLEVRVTSLKERADRLQQEVDTAIQVDLDKASQSRPYFEAKRRLEELQRFRQLIAQKVYVEQTDLNLPKESMVQIIERAVQNDRAVRPNRPLTVLTVFFGSLLIGFILGCRGNARTGTA